MRRLLGRSAAFLGSIGVLVSLLVAGLGWWIAIAAVNRIDAMAIRIDARLAESDVRLSRIEDRVGNARTELAELRRHAETNAAFNSESPDLRRNLERLQSRLDPVFDRLSANADSLLTLSEALKLAADIVDELSNDSRATAGLREAADAIEQGANALTLPQEKVNSIASAGISLTRQAILTLVGKAIEGSEQLATGLARARREAVAARKRMAEHRNILGFRVYAGAIAITLLAAWGGLGQLCLISVGRRQSPHPIATS